VDLLSQGVRYFTEPFSIDLLILMQYIRGDFSIACVIAFDQEAIGGTPDVLSEDRIPFSPFVQHL
jgi:hypothetical protein